jgi:hypothetical protein
MIILMLGTSGCGNWMCDNLGMFCPDDPTSNPEFNAGEDIDSAVDVIKESSNNIEEASSDIAKEANNINQAASEVQNKIPTEIKSKVDSHLKNIKESSISILKDTTKINKAAAELVSAESLLENASYKVTITEGALDDMTKERDAALKKLAEAEADRDSALHDAIRWLILASIVGAGALGVFGFMYSSKMCLTLAGVCIVIMSIAIFVETYFIYLVIGGGIILLGLVGFVIYNIIIQKRAFKEVVDTVEIAQSQMSDSARERLFGGEGESGVMDTIQSPSTIDLVKKEKGKMSNLWSFAKKKYST